MAQGVDLGGGAVAHDGVFGAGFDLCRNGCNGQFAAQAALAANVQVIRVLRLVGARDAYIAGAFVRRFALRSLIGGGCGAALGIGALLVFPNQASAHSFMVGLSFSGLEWLLPLIIPVMIAFVSFKATKAAAIRTLRGMP